VVAVALTVWGFAFAMLPVGFQAWATSEASDQAELAGGLLTSTFQVAIAMGAVFGGCWWITWARSAPRPMPAWPPPRAWDWC
jgi:predicted MFS family arabinose efflux permease